jgi:hypothetical protein
MLQADIFPNQADRCNNIVVDYTMNTRTPDLYIEMFPADTLHNQRTLLNITLQIQDPNGLSIEKLSPQIIIMTLQ